MSKNIFYIQYNCKVLFSQWIVYLYFLEKKIKSILSNLSVFLEKTQIYSQEFLKIHVSIVYQVHSNFDSQNFDIKFVFYYLKT